MCDMVVDVVVYVGLVSATALLCESLQKLVEII